MELVTESALRSPPPRVSHAADPLVRSVLGALAYADLFDYPLSAREIARFQIETSFSVEEVEACLDSSHRLAGMVVRDADGETYCLPGRQDTFKKRRQRGAQSRRVWHRARFYARWVARMPFVRMVAVTGALAMDNIGTRPDIDLLVVATEGRVWICRRMIIALVRAARVLGDDLCPNYIISSSKLDLDQQDLFTAHELAQMVPLYGGPLYRRMIARNSWAFHYLPSGFDTESAKVPRSRSRLLRKLAERVLSSRIFDGWERWELARLQNKLRPLVGDAAEVICSPQQCKGHTGLHRQWVTERYKQRLSELGI